ncbi:hypothetical protein NDU88_009485 [Pleurodeles waltl]|uniref:Uncharacterized protein n=1 Tax=Pleurodeles waltl TaxID=8319 RepID=A0AAV7PS74_PLEWA|nr:hypothetical protein NDU88_009485 [Pleurodeles waltl]
MTTKITNMFLDIYQLFFSRTFLRILDVRKVDELENELLSYLSTSRYRNITWKGVNIHILEMYQIQDKVKSAMGRSLEAFAELGNDSLMRQEEPPPTFRTALLQQPRVPVTSEML